MMTQTAAHTLIMLRHAQSLWNREGRFTGWADPALTEAGIAEARCAAAALRRDGYRFDAAYSSRLERARHTAELVLAGVGQPGLVPIADWRLNERHYGALQGCDKAAMTRAVGAAQVWRWRRGYADLPPALAYDDPGHPRVDPRYRDLPPELLPAAESLADTRRRVAGFWHREIVPHITAGKRLLIAAHGNTLRALLMELQGLSVAEVEGFEIPTGVPIVHDFDRDGVPLGWRYLAMAAATPRAA